MATGEVLAVDVLLDTSYIVSCPECGRLSRHTTLDAANRRRESHLRDHEAGWTREDDGRICVLRKRHGDLTRAERDELHELRRRERFETNRRRALARR